MKHTTENTGNREMNGSSKALCNKNSIGSIAGFRNCSGGTYSKPAIQDVEQAGITITRMPNLFRPPHPAQTTTMGETG